MCRDCETGLGRRKVLGLMGAALAAAAAPRAAFAAGGATTSVTADEALARLKDGNKRYVSAPQVCAIDLATRRHDVAASQAPWATIVGCADSRVPPELLFGGLSLGELFVARNAGNLVDTDTLGTIEYGAAVLGVPLIVVLGHQRCGAVAAACDVVQKNAQFPGSIGPMVQSILPAALAVRGKDGDFVDNAVRESALRTAKRIVDASAIVAALVASGKVKVMAARASLDDGGVEFLA